MGTAIEPGEVATGAMRERGASTPVRLRTTLYALMAALQAEVAPEDDARVVATVVHLLRSRRLTWIGTDTTARCPSRPGLRAPCLPLSMAQEWSALSRGEHGVRPSDTAGPSPVLAGTQTVQGGIWKSHS
jgi:hypothetical protein